MIPQQTPVKNHWGNNSTTVFDFDFYINDAEQIKVTHTDMSGYVSNPVLGVDYTIDQVGNLDGSSITFPIAGSTYSVLGWNESTGEKELLSIALDLPIEQPAEYSMSGDLNKKNLEYSFDYLTRICQIIYRTLERTMKVSESDADFNMNLPQPKANNVFKWKEDETGLENYDIIGENNSFKQGLLSDIAAEQQAMINTINANKTATDEAIADFELSVNSTLQTQGQNLQTQLDTYKQSTNADLLSYKNQVNSDINNFKTSVENTIETVEEAAEKINELEQAVTEAKTSAQTATNKASETAQTLSDAIITMNQKLSTVQQAVEDATEQADIAQQYANQFQPDNTTINRSSANKLQSVGVIDQNAGGALKAWKGNAAQFNAIATKDSHTLYYVVDAGQVYCGDTLISNNYSQNFGAIVTSILPLTDAGLHLADGGLLYKDGIYDETVDKIAQLYAENPSANYFCTEAEWQASITQYGSCGKFVYDSTNNTVRLPKVSDILQGTTDLTALGNLVQAGLPILTTSSDGSHNHTRGTMDITGSVKSSDRLTQYNKFTGATGAFTTSSFNGKFEEAKTYTTETDTGTLNFKASNNWTGSTSSNGAHSHTTSWTGHTNLSTVQPQTIKVLYYIVVANTVKTDIEVDIDEIATDLNGKADRDGSNMNASVKNFDGQWVNVNRAIASDVNFNTGGSEIKTYSLASYLPDDNYTYEVLFTLGGQTAATSGASFGFSFNSDLVLNVFVCRNIARSNAYVNAYGSAIVPLKTRQIKVEQVNNTSYTPTMTTLRICAYRRVGTNA